MTITMLWCMIPKAIQMYNVKDMNLQYPLSSETVVTCYFVIVVRNTFIILHRMIVRDFYL